MAMGSAAPAAMVPSLPPFGMLKASPPYLMHVE
jgi:hypothetical protein